MKMVNLNDQAYINIERIDEIVPWGEYTTRIYIGGNEGYHDINQPIKKVLDAICGSEEHLEDSENKYNISITTDNTGINKIGTKSAVLHYLNKLRADEKLTIKTVI